MDDSGTGEPRREVAAFDFDGTLTASDTVLPFLVRTFGAQRVARAVAQVAPAAARARLGRLEEDLHHRDVVKVRIVRALFRGEDAERIAEAGRHFADTIPRRLRPEVLAKVREHQAAGHDLVIVSASLRPYLEPFAEDHGFDHVIAVGLEVAEDGRLTGELTGPNVRGPEKEVRLRQWLDGAAATIWAYGNSSGDRELLAMADFPVWVAGPDAAPELAGRRRVSMPRRRRSPVAGTD